MKINELHNQPVKPDTYEASMALNQLLKIGKHAIKLHGMIDDHTEMESWVQKKIDLAGDYVKKVHGYMQGENAGLYDDDGMTEDAPFGSGMDLVRMAVLRKFISAEEYMNYAKELKAAGEQVEQDYDDWPEGEGFGSSDGNFAIKDMMSAAGYEFDEQDTSGKFIVTKMPEKLEKMGIKNSRMRDAVTTDSLETRLESKLREDAGEKIANMAQNMSKDEFMSHADELGLTPEEAAEHYEKMSGGAHAGKFEDAGEGHMSKQVLYHTAKYAIELMDMIKKGDDLEGWVQSKLNKAADYLQGVHNYEEYQKLNPYREELDANILQKHAQVVQKNIDEILARETALDDIDTKPGMMRILAKRVNEVEKKLAKENRSNADESGIMYRAGVKKYGKKGMTAIQSAAGKGASHQEIGKIKDKYVKDDAAGVGIITKQNTTADVKPGDEYKNVKKLGLKAGAYESKLNDMLNQRLK